jgi:HEAT repeat protein
MNGHERTIDERIAQLSSPDPSERAEAARRLSNLGPLAVKALPAMLALCDDPNWMVRIQIPRAIIRFRPYDHDVEAALQRLCQDSKEVVRLYAEEAAQRVEASMASRRRRDQAQT